MIERAVALVYRLAIEKRLLIAMVHINSSNHLASLEKPSVIITGIHKHV